MALAALETRQTYRCNSQRRVHRVFDEARAISSLICARWLAPADHAEHSPAKESGRKHQAQAAR